MLGFSNPAWLSPNLMKNPDVKVSEVVEQAASRAETELAGQPEVRAEVQRTIGEDAVKPIDPQTLGDQAARLAGPRRGLRVA